MARRTLPPALKQDMIKAPVYIATTMQFSTYTTVTAQLLPDAYDIQRMDLYVWTSTNNTPTLAYVSSYYRDISPSFIGQTSVIWTNTNTWPTYSIPAVYYINGYGDVVHISYGITTAAPGTTPTPPVTPPSPDPGGLPCLQPIYTTASDGSVRIVGYRPNPSCPVGCRRIIVNLLTGEMTNIAQDNCIGNNYYIGF